MTGVICSGFGGQGVLTAGLILAKIAMDSGLEVTWVPSYGSEMRGGTANCNVKFDTKPIASPFVRNIDLLIALNDPSVAKFESMMRPGGLMAVNSSLVAKGREFRKDVTVLEIPAGDIADELGNPRGVNVILLGAAMAKSALFEKPQVESGLEGYFSEKGKSHPLNLPTLRRGWDAAFR